MYPVDLLPSPVHLVNDLISLLRSASRRVTADAKPNPADFDVNIQTNTGFLPPSPLPNLQKPYDVWEDALSEAQRVLKLGENLPETHTEERAAGEHWRERIRSVSKGLTQEISC